jgi:hypothetical protein
MSSEKPRSINFDVELVEFPHFEGARRVKLELDGYRRFILHLGKITTKSKDVIKAPKSDTNSLKLKRMRLICLLSEGLRKCHAIRLQAEVNKEKSFVHFERWQAMIEWTKIVEETIIRCRRHHHTRIREKFPAAGGENGTLETQTIELTEGSATEHTPDESRWGDGTRERRTPREALFRKGKKLAFAGVRKWRSSPAKRNNEGSE